MLKDDELIKIQFFQKWLSKNIDIQVSVDSEE